MSTADLYDQDFHAWTRAQAEALRRAGRERVNISASIDWQHVAEEIEDMGKSLSRELYSRLFRLLSHLLKWRYQPDHRSSRWRGTIVEQRKELAKLLAQNPSLKPQLPTIMAEAYADARELAAAETELAVETFPVKMPFTGEEVLEAGFGPELLQK